MELKWHDFFQWIQMGRSEDDNGIIVDKLEVNQQEQRDDQQQWVPNDLARYLPGLVNKQLANLKMAIEIVSFPIKNGDFPEFTRW